MPRGAPDKVACRADGQTPCGNCCCTKGVACLDASTGHCGCPAGTTPCGNACCHKGVACGSVANSTCNGAVDACNAGVVCGSTCCASGQCCNTGNVCGSCVPPSVCTSAPTGDLCGGATACPGTSTCNCVSRVGGGLFCTDAAGGGFCHTCTTDADCINNGGTNNHPGFACVTASCCTGGTGCALPCTSGT